MKRKKFRYRENLQDTIFIYDPELAADYTERILETLRSGKVIHYYEDTKEGKRKETVLFLGKAVDFPTGMVHLAHRAGAAIIPCIHLYHRGRVTILMKEPVDHGWEKGEGEYKRIVSEFASLLETYISNSPEQYMGIYGPTVLSEYYVSHHDEKRA